MLVQIDGVGVLARTLLRCAASVATPYRDAVLAVVGDLLEDIAVRTASAPAVGTDTPATIERRRGGSAANVAAAAASIGGAVRFIGRVGLDPLGAQLVADLAATGVDVRAQQVGRTGSVIVLVSGDGERTMLPDRAAAIELRDVDPSWLDGVTWLHVPAYSLLSEPVGSTSMKLISAVRASGGRVSVDVSSVAVVEAFGLVEFVSLLDAIAPDVVFANEPESGLVPLGRPWITVVKHGADPVVVDIPGGSELLSVVVPPLPGVADTTGAGDSFAAGYIVATMAGGSVLDAVGHGIRQAAALLTARFTHPQR